MPARHPTRRTLTLGLLAAGLAPSSPAQPAEAPPGAAPAAGAGGAVDAFTRLTLTVNGEPVAVRAYLGLPTVRRPVEPAYQAINLYVPEAYFRGEPVGRYTAETAPIFLPNGVGGYMPAKPGTPEGRGGPPGSAGARPVTAAALALSRGLVVAAPGARGRTLRGADGAWTGKAPAAIVDLKAAVRWLRHHAGRFPGNPERIISNGTSAGGALSALLGASGGAAAYDEALDAVGAWPGRDDIHAVSAFCPITLLELADGAYEWQFQGLTDYRHVALQMLDYQVQRREVVGQLTAAQQALAGPLRQDFIARVNALALRDADGQVLSLAADGQGPLREHLAALLLASAREAQARGADLSGRGWLTRTGGTVTAVDWPGYVRALGRMKGLPAFDGLALETGENSLFGDARTDTRHFTAFAHRHSQVPSAALAEPATVALMSPLAQLTDPATRPARHWRIRHGSADRDTSLAVPALLAAAVRRRGASVDLAFPWDRPHSGDYDLDALFDWVDTVVAAA